DRMRLGEDRLVERLRELLPESERAEVIDRAPRYPAVAELGSRHAIDTVSGVFDQRIAGKIAAVLNAVKDQVEIRLRRRLATEVQMVGVPARGEILKQIGRIHAAVDVPVVAHAEHVAEL